MRKDKLREVKAGHDGTWVAHPGLVPVAKEIFDAVHAEPNQIAKPRTNRSPITAQDLLAVPDGEITEAGLRWNIDVGMQYLESWLRGNGCVPIYNLMEDAATAEIRRAQVWQWVQALRPYDQRELVTDALVKQVLKDRVAEMSGDEKCCIRRRKSLRT